MLNLPTDKPRPEVQSFRGSSESLQLPMPLLQEINALSKREGVTLFMLLLAAFKALLSRYTEQSDIVIGSPIANRNRVELEGLIGFFVNTTDATHRPFGNPTFHELRGACAPSLWKPTHIRTCRSNNSSSRCSPNER